MAAAGATAALAVERRSVREHQIDSGGYPRPMTDQSNNDRPGAVSSIIESGTTRWRRRSDASALAELAEFGNEQVVEAGDVLYRAGDASYDFFVVLEGRVEIVRQDIERDDIIASFTAGGFMGELSLLTGQRPYLTGRVVESGRVLRIGGDGISSPHERQARHRRPDLQRVLGPERASAPGGRRSSHSDRRLSLLLRSDGAPGVRHPFSSAP